MPDNPLQVFVDKMLDYAVAENPGVELTITMSSANSLLLPLHARRAVRVVDGVIGSYAGHVYRDCLINNWPDLDDDLIAVGTFHELDDERTPTYYCSNLTTGQFSTTAPNIVTDD